jgi:two-component system, NtrC family, nitrogen regulation sensor histidine kinase NtrY
LSIKLKLILVVMTIFVVFLATAILVSIEMLNRSFEAGQSKHASHIIELSVNLLRKAREKELLPPDSLAIYETQTVNAMADYKQRQIFKDDLLKKLVLLLLLNAILFCFLGYCAIVFFVSRALRPVINLTKNIARYPDLIPENLELDHRSDKEVRLLTEQFKHMLESVIMYQKKLQARSKIDGWMEMSRAIVHEVGNAITPARNSVELLKKESPENTNVMAVQKSIARMEDIFRHIRQFYKSQEIIRSHFDIVQELRFLCQGYEAKFCNHTGFDSIVLSGGKTECTQLFSNLIKNATEASKPGEKTEVKVDLAIDENSAMITISDNGCGIAEEMIDKIFSPGYSSKSSGFGIGLALVEKIITLHEWSINVNSKPGKGAQFTITIPKRDIHERISTAAR